MGNACCQDSERGDQEVVNTKAPMKEKTFHVQNSGAPYFKLGSITLNGNEFKGDTYKNSAQKETLIFPPNTNASVTKRIEYVTSMLSGYGVTFSFNLTDYNGINNPIQVAEQGNKVYVGQVNEIDPNGNPIKQGKGYLLLENNSMYVGYFFNNKYYGPGLYFDFAKKDAKFGFWEDDRLSGIVEITYHNGNNYRGQFSGGYRNGQGVQRSKNGDVYSGNFVNGAFQGKGEFTWSNGDHYSGDWYNDKMNGKCVHIWKESGVKYEGHYLNGQFHGQGMMLWPDGSRYEGEWKNGLQDGEGVKTKKDGRTTKGVWKEGKFQKP